MIQYIILHLHGKPKIFDLLPQEDFANDCFLNPFSRR